MGEGRAESSRKRDKRGGGGGTGFFVVVFLFFFLLFQINVFGKQIVLGNLPPQSPPSPHAPTFCNLSLSQVAYRGLVAATPPN